MDPAPTAETAQAEPADLTVDELAARVGVPVRTIRFYAGKKLLPPPRLEGRTGRYGAAHLARLALIRDLQAAGYTLAAVEQFLGALPLEADADEVALFGTLLTPWAPAEQIVLTRAELARRMDRDVDDALLDKLQTVGILQVRPDGRIAAAPSQLELGLRMLDVDAPFDALIEACEVIRHHAAGLAADLQQVFRERIVSELDGATPQTRERLRALSEALRPLTIQAIVTAYTRALEREVRNRPDRA